MKKFFLVCAAALTLSPIAHAEIYDEVSGLDVDSQYADEMMMSYDDAEISYVVPGRGRPGPYPGDPRRPEPPRRPGYPPPRRPEPPRHPQPPRTQLVRCDSEGYRYRECGFSYYGARNVRIYRQHSDTACRYGSSYGFSSDRVWVDKGCRATFEVVYW